MIENLQDKRYQLENNPQKTFLKVLGRQNMEN